MNATMEHTVETYDQRADGMAIVAGFSVLATVTAASGRKFSPVRIAVCGSRDDAQEIADLLNAKYDENAPPDPEVVRLREALERCYQTGRGPHVAIAREALDA